MPTHNPYIKSNSGAAAGVNSPVPEATMMNNPSEEVDISNVDHAMGRAKKTQGGDGAVIKLFERPSLCCASNLFSSVDNA